MKHYSLNETFFITQDTTGEPLELPSSDVAMACLAFDLKSKQLVELHVLTHSDAWSDQEAQTLSERLTMLGEINGGSVPQVLRQGRLDGLVFFTLALEEGETVEAYTERTGSIAESATLNLIDGLITKLERLRQFPRLFRACSLRHAKLIYSPQGPHHQRVIQIQQFGLHTLEGRGDDFAIEARLTAELGQLLYQMLTGHPSPMRGGPLVESVRLFDRCVLLRQFVIQAFTKAAPLQTLADAASALSSARAHATESGTASLGMAPFAVPWLSQIFGTNQLDFLYPVQFELSRKPAAVIEAISCRSARDSRARQSVFLLPLPGRRVLPRTHFTAAPAGLTHLRPDQAENLLLPHSTWNSDHFCFHVESVSNSFTLSVFINQRGHLQPSEIVAILSQIECARQQALALGFTIPSLRSSAVRCVFRDDCDETTLAERCRMPISHWPSHLIKLRVHATLTSVTNPWPAGIAPDRPANTLFNDAFALLAVEMAGGARALAQPSELPADLMEFLRQQAQAANGQEPVLEPAAFLRTLDQRSRSSLQPLVQPEAPTTATSVISADQITTDEIALPVEPEAVIVDSPAEEPLPQETVAEELEPPILLPEAIESEIAEPLPEIAEFTPVDAGIEADDAESSSEINGEPMLEPELDPSTVAVDVPIAANEADEPANLPLLELETIAEIKPTPETEETTLPLTHPKAIAAYFSTLNIVPTGPSTAPSELSASAPTLPVFQPFQERANPVVPELPDVPSPDPDLATIAPFPTEELETTPETESPPMQTPSPVATIQPKSFPPSTSGLVTWRFESSPRPTSLSPAQTSEVPPPLAMAEVAEAPLLSSPPTLDFDHGLMSAQSPTEPTAVESAPSIEDLLEDLPPEDFGAPTLNIDLSRLTTSDSLFSRRPRTITIRNR